MSSRPDSPMNPPKVIERGILISVSVKIDGSLSNIDHIESTVNTCLFVPASRVKADDVSMIMEQILFETVRLKECFNDPNIIPDLCTLIWPTEKQVREVLEGMGKK